MTVLLLLYLTVLPLGFLVYGAFVDDIGSLQFTLANVIRVYADRSLLPLLGRTAMFAFGASGMALVLGGGTAWLTERTPTRLGPLVAGANLVTLTLPSLLLAIAWASLLAPRAGYINVALVKAFGLSSPPFNIYSLPGMIWVEGMHGAPFAYLLMLPVFRSMDRGLEEAARTSGAGHRVTAWKITVPLVMPAMLSVLVFRVVRGFESFEIPAVLGLPAGVDVLVSRVYRIISGERAYGAANAYALGLILVATAGIYLYSRATRDAQRFSTITGKGGSFVPHSIGWYQAPANAFLLLYVAVLVALPLLTLLWNAFLPYPMAPSLGALHQTVLKNFHDVFASDRVLQALVNTVFVGAITAVATVLITSVVAWVLVRSSFRGKWLLDVLTFLPLTMPGIILGVALIWIYLTLPVPVYGTLAMIVVAYTTSLLPIPMRFISPALTQIHRDLEAAAQTSGAGWWMTFRRVVFPLLFPAALGSGLYVFILVFGILSAVIVIYTPSTMVIPVLVFQMWGESAGNAVYALLALTTLFLLPFAATYYWLIRRYGLTHRTAA